MTTQDRLRALVEGCRTLADERFNDHPQGQPRHSTRQIKTLRQCADKLSALLNEAPPICPHCHLPAVMPEVCTPAVNAAIEERIASDAEMFTAGREHARTAEPRCSCWIGRGDQGGWAPDRQDCATHSDSALLAASRTGTGPLSADDIAQIIEGIEHFIIEGDPEVAAIWQPYIDKLRGPVRQEHHTRSRRMKCATCDGTGYVCDVCREADGECTCEDGPEVIKCDSCDGTGEIADATPEGQ